MKNYELSKEIKKWEERVLFDVKFKPNTKANLERLKEILFNSLEHFTIISANSEALVYKIGRFFIENNVKNDSIAFVDGKIIESYLADGSAEWKKKERTDDFFDIFHEDFKNKWVLIPLMSFEISVGLAIYFISQMKKCQATGLIFYAEGPSNMTEVLSLETENPYFYEYPIKKYRKRKRQIQDDEY